MSLFRFIIKNKFFIITCLLLGVHYILWGILKIDLKDILILCYSLCLVFHYIGTHKSMLYVSKKQIFLTIIALALIIQGQSATYRVVWILFFGVCMFYTEYKDFINVMCFSSVMLILLLIISLCCGILNYEVSVVDDRIRYTLGEANPNAISLFILSFLISFCLKYDTLKIKFIIMIIMLILFVFTNSRTALCVYLLYLIFYAIVKFTYRHNLLFVFLLTCICLFVFLCPWYINRILIDYPILDVILSKRLYLFSEYIALQNIMNYIVGGRYPTNGMAVDNSYLVLLFSSGIVVYIMWLLALLRASVLFYKKSMYNELSYVWSFSILGLFESSLIRAVFFFTLIYWFIIFYPNKLPKLNKINNY